MHSISKGLIGESGLKGGYMYLHNFNPAVVEQVVKLKSVNISGNSMGQIALDIMVNPPLEGVSKETKEKYLYETSSLLESLKHRAKLLTKHLNEMTNVHVKEIDGAMCAFPEIKFSERVLQAA
jgi:aspartate/methionine/tyrosine aminotransferase